MNTGRIVLGLRALIAASIMAGCAQGSMKDDDGTSPAPSAMPGLQTNPIAPNTGSSGGVNLLPDQGESPGTNPAGTPAPIPKVPTGPGCSGFVITQPLPGSVAEDGMFEVKGTVEGAGQLNIDRVQVGRQAVTIQNDNFSTNVQLPNGSHTIQVQCGVHRREVSVTAGIERPWITVEQPAVGAMIPGTGEPIKVIGRVDTMFGVETLTINQQPVQVDPTGRFEYDFAPELGMNHIVLAAKTMGGAETDMVRSFVYGKFRPFKNGDGPSVFIRVSQSGLNAVSDAIAKNLRDGGLADAVEPSMGRNGDIELHRFEFDDIKVKTEAVDGGLKVRITLDDFGLHFTYHYRALGFIGGRIRGWARARPLELHAKVNIRPDGNGGFSADLSDIRAELNNFRLDLNDFYSIVEGLLQPMVKDMGKKAITDALKSVVIGQILQRELLRQPIDILGRPAELAVGVETLNISPGGIEIQGKAALSSLQPVHDAPGVISLGSSAPPPRGPGDLEIAVNADLFNSIFTEAWRAGLLDQDLTQVLAESGTTLSTALLAGVAGDGLLDTFGVTDIGIAIKAALPPVARTAPDGSGRIDIHLGALRLELSSVDANGDEKVWAVLTLRGIMSALPVWDNGAVKMDVTVQTALDLSESPVFPIDEEAFESFLSTLVEGLPASLAEQLADTSVSFDNFEAIGVRIQNMTVSTPPGASSFLRFGVDLRAR